VRSLRGAPLLTGGRATEPVDVPAVARLSQRVGEILLEESLDLLELNPVLAGPAGAVAVDATARRRDPGARVEPSEPGEPAEPPIGSVACTT
jgi:hypothetical protein